MKKDPSSTDEFYNVSSLAAYLGVTRETIRRWIKSGRLPEPITISPIVRRWRKSEIHAWLATHEPQKPATSETESTSASSDE